MAGSAYLTFRVFVRGESVRVPQLEGLLVADARATLSDTGLEIDVDDSRNSYSENVPIDAVVWQSVEPGRRVKRGSRVFVARSLGPLVTRIPEMEGESTRSALVELSDRSLSLDAISRIAVEGRSGIVATTPPQGSQVGRQAGVSILVAENDTLDRYVMPDLIDRSAAATRARLTQLGFNVGPVRYETYPGIGDGIIIRQVPLPGSPVTRESLITLTVSRGGATEFTEEGATTMNPWEENQ